MNIELYSPFSKYLSTIPLYNSLECARSLNKVGKFSLELPLTHFPDFFFWKTDMIFRIYRNIGNTRYLVGNTVWYLEDVEVDFDSGTINLTGHDTVGLLERLLVAYTKGTDYAEKTVDFGLSDYASNLIKQFLRENAGTLVFDTDRDLSDWITIPDDNDLGAATEKEAAFATLASTFSSLCDRSAQEGVPLFFDLVPDTDNRLTLKVVENQLGVDRSTYNPIVFSPLMNNLIKPTLARRSSDSTNVGYIGGDGQDEARLIVKLTNSAALARTPWRREKLFDESDIGSETLLTQRGKELMRTNSEKYFLSGQALDLPGQLFGVHYGYGDKVQINLNNFVTSALVQAFSIKSDSEGDKLDIKLAGEVTVS